MNKKDKYWRSVVGLIGLALMGPGIRITTATSPVSASFDLVFPSGYALSRVAVAANGDLALGPGDQIVATDGSPGSVTNSGTGLLSVGPNSNAGNIASAGSIQLGPNVSARSAQSSGMVTLSPGDIVGSIQQGATLTPFVHRTVVVPIPSGMPSNVSIQPGTSATLAPGRYGTVTIGPGAVVTISAGIYVADNFNLGPQATLQLDTSGGTVTMYVNQSAVWNGGVSGDASRFVFGFLGQGSLVLDSADGAFRGTALAPLGTLELKASSTAYQGTFYGKHLIVGPNTTIQEIPTPLLLDGLTVSNTTPCIGEPTEVSLQVSDEAGPGARAWIQGVVGSHQFVQFSDAPTSRLIWGTVYTPDGRADFTSVPITVKQCVAQPGAAPIALHFWAALRKPNVVELMVHNYDTNGHEIPPTGSATYAWSFGDGQTATTNSPFVSHDYAAAINPLAQYSYFEVSVTRGAANAKKVVPIWSLYAKNRAKGIIQPPNTLSASSLNLALAVTNYEPTPISITQANVELIPCDPALDSRPQTPQALSMTLAAGATVTVNVAPPTSIASDVCGIGIHLMGSAAGGRVYTDAYTRLKENPFLVQAVTDPSTVALLNQASALTKDPKQFDEFELRELYAAGLIPQLPPSDPPSTASTPHLARAAEPAAKVVPASIIPLPGDPCTPGDTSPIPGLVCAPTGGWVFVGPEILNAFKGNFVMDHGCGFIGQLLSSVNQHYSHTSTIVKNRVEVRHSTSSTDRMNSNVNYLNEELDPNTLRYGFPGTAGPNQAYTIDQMVNQYCITDPDNPASVPPQPFPGCPAGEWRMGGELSPDPVHCKNDITAVPSLVIRPAPDESASGLQAVASVADHTNINSHYRFFNYSRADELLPGSDWAVGTESTVCSSFDRLAAKGANLPLHPKQMLPGVPDGMELYKADVRLTAGQALYAQVFGQVSQSCNPASAGTLGAIIGGASGLLGGPVGIDIGGVLGIDYCDTMINNITNQVANCFANDGCADTSSNNWANPGMGIAVSPDDMLNWDDLHSGGTYGYPEHVAYNPKAWRHAYAWTASPGWGTITVKVIGTDNKPFPNATVLINTNAVGTTDSITGSFQIPVIAAGTYEIGAQFYCDAAKGCTCQPAPGSTCTSPVLEQANTTAVLQPNGSITVTLTLCAGPLVGGVPTSCPQPGQGGSALKACVSIALVNDFADEPVLTLFGSGFTPGPVQVGYTGVPGNLYGSGAKEYCCALGDGSLGGGIVIGIGQGGAGCFPSGFNATVTIGVEDPRPNTATQISVPAKYWCQGNGLNPGDVFTYCSP